eukprot:TRINITY_DN9949_c0_g1_i1.p3 TRINITY_DN9949_c0_g1~~TRINITY_DN9949_c0_g1_i1.p3  ORF type:complete len:184 (-),score=43.30 TRINITY_DN9949_c0_g1_i1:273-824(-)
MEIKKKDRETSAKDFRDAILYEQVLRTEKDILIYNCRGWAFFMNWLATLITLVGAGYVINAIHAKESYEGRRKKLKLPFLFVCIAAPLGRIVMHRRFQKVHVDSVIYHTQDQTFTLTKRGMLTGRRLNESVHKNELLYTQDPSLNAKRINYINMRTLDCYGIGYAYAWKNKKLFAHLLAQRIR